MEGYLYDGWNPFMITQLDPSNPAAVPVRIWCCIWKPDVGSSLYARSSWQKAGGVGGLAWMQTGIAQTLADAAGGTLYGAAEVYVPMSDHRGNVRHYYQIKSSAVVSFPSTITGQVSASFEYDAFGREVRATGLKVSGNTAPPGSPPNNPPPGLVADTSYADALPFHFSTTFTDPESGLNYYGYRYYDPRDGRWLNRDPIGESGGLNLYGMVGNDPQNFFDILGLSKIEKVDNCVIKIFAGHGIKDEHVEPVDPADPTGDKKIIAGPGGHGNARHEPSVELPTTVTGSACSRAASIGCNSQAMSNVTNPIPGYQPPQSSVTGAQMAVEINDAYGKALTLASQILAKGVCACPSGVTIEVWCGTRDNLKMINKKCGTSTIVTSSGVGAPTKLP